MAANVEAVADTTANEDNDDLDAILDSALEDFHNTPLSTCESIEKELEKEKEKPKIPAAPSLDELGFSENDVEAVAIEFEKSMKSILGDNNEMLKEWDKFADSTASNPESLPESSPAFEAYLLKTMKDMAENTKTMPTSPDLDENFMKAMADMGMDEPDGDFNLGLFPMMQGMMMNLLSKDVLYPALSDLKIKYPGWLSEKKSLIPPDVYEKYSNQYKLVRKICAEYESENETDSDEIKKKRFDKLMELMQKMQSYGQPPNELIGAQGEQCLGDTNNAEKCPVM